MDALWCVGYVTAAGIEGLVLAEDSSVAKWVGFPCSSCRRAGSWTTSGGPMMSLQARVCMSHMRIVLSREPVMILDLRAPGVRSPCDNR